MTSTDEVHDAPTPAFEVDWALFLDVDGTLVEFADDPDRVGVGPELVSVLGELYRQRDGALALVSGRTIASIDVIFEPLRLPVAGVHGYERRDARGRTHRADVNARPLAAVRARFDELARRHPGTFIEDKGPTFAFHYRRAPDAANDVESLANELDSGLPEPFCLLRGKMVVEVRARTASKGSAIEAFMSEPPFEGCRPIFVGDDATDEHGFRSVNERDGMSFKVGPGATCALYRFVDVADVVQWLQRYSAFLRRMEGEVREIS